MFLFIYDFIKNLVLLFWGLSRILETRRDSYKIKFCILWLKVFAGQVVTRAPLARGGLRFEYAGEHNFPNNSSKGAHTTATWGGCATRARRATYPSANILIFEMFLAMIF